MCHRKIHAHAHAPHTHSPVTHRHLRPWLPNFQSRISTIQVNYLDPTPLTAHLVQDSLPRHRTFHRTVVISSGPRGDGAGAFAGRLNSNPIRLGHFARRPLIECASVQRLEVIDRVDCLWSSQRRPQHHGPTRSLRCSRANCAGASPSTHPQQLATARCIGCGRGRSLSVGSSSCLPTPAPRPYRPLSCRIGSSRGFFLFWGKSRGELIRFRSDPTASGLLNVPRAERHPDDHRRPSRLSPRAWHHPPRR